MKFENIFKTTICLFVICVILLGQRSGKLDYRLHRNGFKYIEGSDIGFSNDESIKVQIWGEVKQTGIYVVPNYASLLDVISIAGGPKPEANLSKIRLINRNIIDHQQVEINEMIIDLEEFLQSGKFVIEPNLGSESVIIIPRNKRARFFESLPKILNVLNIISVSILLYSWLK